MNGADPWRTSQRLKQIEALPELFQRSGYYAWGMGKLFHAPLPRRGGAASRGGGKSQISSSKSETSSKFEGSK